MRTIAQISLFLALLALTSVAIGPGRVHGAAGKTPKGKKMQERLGMVVFQFDDGSAGHYTYGFRILEKYDLKGPHHGHGRRRESHPEPARLL